MNKGLDDERKAEPVHNRTALFWKTTSLLRTDILAETKTTLQYMKNRDKSMYGTAVS